MEDQDIINEFLIESAENLSRLEQEIVELEQRPSDPQLLAGIFRTIHTIKGTCGFLSFSNLEGVTHIAENLLSQLRNGERTLNPALISLILETVDIVKKELAHIESSGKESGEPYEDLRKRLTLACEGKQTEQSQAPDPQKSITGKPESEEAAASQTSTGSSQEVERSTVGKQSSVADSTIRVDVGLLDKLMNLVGELVLARNQILQFNSRQEDANLNSTAQRLNLITTQLQEGVMKTRLQPIGVVWNKLPRVVRDLAASCDKQIQLVMDGADTELDKSIIEAIKDPLTHIVRNCCDHGIETPAIRTRNGKSPQGTLALRAYHEGGQVNIEISDDGAGVDPVRVKQKAIEKGLLRPEQAERLSDRETVNLLFLPGFSTAEQVTSISGRGVGMDVVKTNVEKIGGAVDLSSRVGEGTTVKIKIPLTLAIIPGLVVNSGGERFVIPQVSLLELLRLEEDTAKNQIERIHGTPVYRRRGRLLPLVYMNEALGLATRSANEAQQVVNVVVLQAEDRQFGLVVDSVLDTQEIVVKPLGKQLKKVECFAGATIMGDGGVALILDVARVGRKAIAVQEREEAHSESEQERRSAKAVQTYLLFRAAGLRRAAIPLAEASRLEEVPQSSIEFAAGRPVIQYRGDILPLISLSQVLGKGHNDTAFQSDPVHVVVLRTGERSVGLAVDEIIDIATDVVERADESSQRGVLLSTRIGGKVTDLLDLQALFAACGAQVFPDVAQSLDALRAGISQQWEPMATVEVVQ
jgi:two-component system chemotaxis sensor kinase CheA